MCYLTEPLCWLFICSHVCEGTIGSMFYSLFSLVKLWNYTRKIIHLRLAEYCQQKFLIVDKFNNLILFLFHLPMLFFPLFPFPLPFPLLVVVESVCFFFFSFFFSFLFVALLIQSERFFSKETESCGRNWKSPIVWILSSEKQLKKNVN